MQGDSRSLARPHMENRPARDGKGGCLGGVISQNFTMPCQGTLPLMIPATVDHLARMLTALYGAEQARVLAEDVVRKGVEVPRRGTGGLVATGFFTLRADTLGQVRIVAQGTQPIAGAAAPLPDARPASDLVEAALAWLCESQDALPVVKEALRRVSRPDQDVTLETEYRSDHDRLMNLSAVSVLDQIERRRPKVVVDADLPAALSTGENREGLALLFALGLVHHFNLLSGLSQEVALLHTLTFFEGLGPGQEKLLAVLAARGAAGEKVIDNADDFARFLTKGAGAAEPVKRHQAALIAKLERVERAYAHRQLREELLDEEGRPRLKELGVAGLRERAHQTISRTYISAVEELAAVRVAAEMQEGGVEVVMGFLGRAGLVEQLLMAAAEVVPTAELRSRWPISTAPSGRSVSPRFALRSCARWRTDGKRRALRFPAWPAWPPIRRSLCRSCGGRSWSLRRRSTHSPAMPRGPRVPSRARTRTCCWPRPIATSLPKRPSMAGARADYTARSSATWPFSDRRWMRSSRRSSSNLSSVPIGCHPRGPFGMSRCSA